MAERPRYWPLKRCVYI